MSSLKVEDQVAAYDPATGKANVQTIQHTYINQDTNLLAVTLRTVASTSNAQVSADSAVKQRDAAVAAHGAHAPPAAGATIRDETIQTTTNHPWLTADHGWILASFLRVGEPMERVDGSTAVVVAVRAEPGTATMWDLTVSQVHTFAVGNGAYGVHNCGDPEGQVKYGETELSSHLRDARRAAGDVDHNYAAARLDNGEIRVARSTGGYHAEEFLVDDAENDGRTIEALYSERQPCANLCADYLMDHNPAMKVSWTWDWEGENPALSRQIREFMRGQLG